MTDDTISKQEFLAKLDALIPDDARLALYSQMAGWDVVLDDDTMGEMIAPVQDVFEDDDNREANLPATHYVMA